MRNEFILWGNGGSPPSWMKNGLVAYYDPYRDAYGRNCVAVGAVDVSGFTKYGATTSGESLLETATTGEHVGIQFSMVLPSTLYAWQVEVKPNGRTKIYVSIGSTSNRYACFTLTGDGSILAKENNTAATVTALSDGYYRCCILATPTAGNTGIAVGTLPDDATSISNKSFAGDAEKGLYVRLPQLNLGQLFPYSAPAGAPGTLQTLADYSGLANSLTLGASTSAGADDPAFTGVAVQHATDDILLGTALTSVVMLGDWTIPMVVKPAGTTGTIVSLADGTKADQYQAVEYNGSTKVRIHTVNGATSTYSDDLTVSNSTVQMLVLTSSGNTLTLTNMGTGASVTATNADPTGNPRVCVGGVGTSTVGGLADALSVYLLGLVNRAWGTGEATRVYRYWKSLEAGRGVAIA